MVAPVTGPHVTSYDNGSASLHRSSYRQARPYNLLTTYHASKGNTFGPNYIDAWRYQTWAINENNNTSALYAQAYDRLIRQLGDTVGLGITLVQWRQADAMVRNRVNQLSSFATSLARRSPVGVAAALGVSLRDVRAIMRTRYGTSRKLSDLWLEFWFGWKPIVSDIYNAVEIFDQDLPWGRLKATARSVDALRIRQPATSSMGEEGIAYGTASRVSVGVSVRVKNPNARLLNQFGLLNPAVVAFDAIPWSFVLGWFSNVNSWLASFTDFAGLETSNAFIVRKTALSGYTFWSAWPPRPPQGPGGPGIGSAYSRVILPSIPRPAFRLIDLSLKPTRALTAITLLVQKLPKV